MTIAILFTLWTAIGGYLFYYACRKDVPFDRWRRKFDILAGIFITPGILGVLWMLYEMWRIALN